MELNSVPFPWVCADENLNITDSNDRFSEEFFNDRHEIKLLGLKDLCPDFDPAKRKQICRIGGHIYLVSVSKDNGCMNVFFDRIIQDSAGVAIGLIFTDNLTECLDNVEDKRRGVVKVILENKINDYFQSGGGIVRNFENDKYLVILTSALLDKCRYNKFSILDSVKQIDCGEGASITISMGLGINGKTLKESLDFAKTAIELALSRGGDQAVIKNNEAYEYFGGKTSSVKGNSRVRARAKAYALSDLISECSNILVMGHKNADFDSLGACVGICKIARTFGKAYNIVLGNVSSAVSPLFDRLAADKNYKDCFVKPDAAEKLVRKNTLLVIVDCHVADYSENAGLIDSVKKYVVFDHHRKIPGAISGYVLSYLEPRASSASELICEMFKYMSRNFRLTSLEAEAMLAGIMLDTKQFTVKTSVQTFEAASFLKKQGADTINVKLMFKESVKTYFDRIDAIRNCKIINDNMAVTVCGDDCENPLLTAATTADELLKISGIEASFVLARAGDYINISMRSLGKINTSRIAEKLGGGGHFETSACQIKTTDTGKAEAMLNEKIAEYLKEE